MTNPSLIIEVLSDSTEAYDRGDKFTYYKSIPNLSEYLLVARRRPHVTQFIKQDEGAWLQREFNELDEVLKISSLECELPLSQVYQDVHFAEIRYRAICVLPPINFSDKFYSARYDHIVKLVNSMLENKSIFSERSLTTATCVSATYGRGGTLPPLSYQRRA